MMTRRVMIVVIVMMISFREYAFLTVIGGAVSSVVYLSPIYLDGC